MVLGSPRTTNLVDRETPLPPHMTSQNKYFAKPFLRFYSDQWKGYATHARGREYLCSERLFSLGSLRAPSRIDRRRPLGGSRRPLPE